MAIKRGKNASSRNQGGENMAYSDEQVKDIFELMTIVIENATGKYSEYAKTYAEASFEAFVIYADDGLRMQIPYVLANLQNWRGEEARFTKSALKEYIR